MDVRKMTYADETFDLIIDKSTIDAILCADTPYLNVTKMLSECQRVLKTGGRYVANSFGNPVYREYLFLGDHLGFYLETFKIKDKDAIIVNNRYRNEEKGNTYIYICEKMEDAAERHKEHYNSAI